MVALTTSWNPFLESLLRNFEESSPYTLGIDPKALESIRTIRRRTPSSLESATLMNGLDLDSVGLVSISDFVAWIWISSPYAWNRSPFLRRTLFGFAAWIGARLRMYACRTLWIPFVRNPFSPLVTPSLVVLESVSVSPYAWNCLWNRLEIDPYRPSIRRISIAVVAVAVAAAVDSIAFFMLRFRRLRTLCTFQNRLNLSLASM